LSLKRIWWPTSGDFCWFCGSCFCPQFLAHRSSSWKPSQQQNSRTHAAWQCCQKAQLCSWKVCHRVTPSCRVLSLGGLAHPPASPAKEEEPMHCPNQLHPVSSDGHAAEEAMTAVLSSHWVCSTSVAVEAAWAQPSLPGVQPLWGFSVLLHPVPNSSLPAESCMSTLHCVLSTMVAKPSKTTLAALPSTHWLPWSWGNDDCESKMD